MASSQPPALNVMQPTPPRSYKQHHRLLYRGSLALPDSDLVLDGIAFTAHLPPTSPTSLLESPLALALESMRGRPSLRLVSVVNMSEVSYECPGDINMYIHPRSIIARSFFENVLCMDRVGIGGYTKNAIRIGLGDGYGPDESDLLAFGSLLPSQSTLRLKVARITPPRPPVDRIRKPRPDDPAPRRPPVFDLPRKSTASKRRRIDEHDAQSEGRHDQRKKIDQGINLKALMARDAMFKLPGIASSASIKGKGKGRINGQSSFSKFSNPLTEVRGDEDVFGTADVRTPSRSVEINEFEALNKTVVKKAAVKALAARGMPKEHPEFKELFGWVTRGVGFALRRKMKTVKTGLEEVERLVDSHVTMYFDGFGGPINIGNG